MYSSSYRRWLPFLVLFVALHAAPQTGTGWVAENSTDVTYSGATTSAESPTMVRPSARLTMEQMGDRFFISQQYQAAIQTYAQVAQPSAVVWNKMGISYQMMYDLKGAVRCYKESLKLRPTDAKVLNNLATAEEELEDFPAAEHNYRKALELDPYNAQFFKNLGTNLLMQGQNDRGAEAYKHALAINSHILDARFGPKVNEPGGVQALGEANYIKAQSCAQAGLTDCALSYLQLAFNEGSATVKKVAADADFASLRGTPGLAHLLAAQR